ncbi:MAG: dephospho-CoA kinase [Kangiellaceae bacterium]|nr:dephospho-CoA kinase [Kangiellaceae bacterium]
MAQLRIALTGGIASGKSSVCILFAKLGIDIIDTDKIARKLFEPSSLLLNDLREKFGNAIFNEDRSLNRQALRRLDFSNKAHLHWLNQLTHPKIKEEVIDQLTQSSSPYAVIDIPLLVTTKGQLCENMKGLFDRIVVVKVEDAVQISRLINRDKSNTEEAQKVVNSQSTLQQKLEYADDVIDNNGDISKLEPQVNLLHNKYLKLAQQLKSS